MTAHLVLASTTSHKREPLLPTLDAFARLGLRDLDINLHHFIELGASVDEVASAVAANGQRVWVASGGWCDFFDAAPAIDETMQSVDGQVALAGRLGARMLRLFFGRRSAAAYRQQGSGIVTANLRRLSARHPDMMFVFENHDGASLVPEICREIVGQVDRPNIRVNFDPINFARAGVDPAAAESLLEPLVAHAHLKGLEAGEFCEYGSGDVDLTPILRTLLQHGYAGHVTVEYEGRNDSTLRLWQSVEHARHDLACLACPDAV